MRETHLGKSTKQSIPPIKRHNNKYLSQEESNEEFRGESAANILSPHHRPQATQPPTFTHIFHFSPAEHRCVAANAVKQM